jgi:hypothetical protein
MRVEVSHRSRNGVTREHRYHDDGNHEVVLLGWRSMEWVWRHVEELQAQGLAVRVLLDGEYLT